MPPAASGFVCPSCSEHVARCSECLHAHDWYDEVGPGEHMCEWCLRSDYEHDPGEQSPAVATHRPSRAHEAGTICGLAAFALAALLQAVVAVISFDDYNWPQRFAYAVLPFLLTAALLVPVRPTRWPLTRKRVVVVGLVWLIVGLPMPAWLFFGQLPIAAAALAGSACLIGAGVARTRDL